MPRNGLQRHVPSASPEDRGRLAPVLEAHPPTLLASATIRMVCLDLGGVILRHCRTWAEGVHAAGLDLRPEPEHTQSQRLQSAFMLICGMIDADRFCHECAAAEGSAYDPQEVRAIHANWLGEPYEGVETVLERLIAQGRVDTGLLSNIDEPHWRRVERAAEEGRLPALGLLRHRLPSFRLGLAKPMPGIYEAFEAATGCSGAEILFLDDLEENVRAADARGWHAHRIDWTTDTAPQIEAALVQHGLL